MNAASCQSYSLAVALTLADMTQRYEVKTAEDLRELEAEIRLRVQQSMTSAGRHESTRDDWKSAIEQLTFGEFTVRGQSFASYEDLSEFLNSRVSIHQQMGTLEFVISRPTVGYLASFADIRGISYSQGHVVTILGQARADQMMSKRESLLLVNSADKDAICSFPSRRTRYFGFSGWVDDYQLKYLRLDWIEHKHK